MIWKNRPRSGPPSRFSEASPTRTQSERTPTVKPETMTTATALLAAGIPDKNERAEVLKFFERPLPRDTLLTTRKAAHLAGVHRKTLFGWERKGYLHPKRITPSRVRWSKRELESFLCETVG